MYADPRIVLTPVYNHRDYYGYRKLIDQLGQWFELDNQTQDQVELEASRYNPYIRAF